MNRFAPLSSLATVFSLFLVLAIWLTPALANTPPATEFISLGQLRASGMGAPVAMDLDNVGNLYVADALGRKIYCFDQYGILKRVYSDADFKYADAQGLTSGRGLAVSPDGKRLYFTRDRQALILDTATGAVIGELAGSGDAPELKLAGEIDLDANGNVFVVDAGSGRQKIKVYSPDGAFINQFGGVGNLDGTFQSIASMTINGAGQIVVADASPASLSGKIQVFTVDANYNVVSKTGYLKNTAANFGAVEMHTPRGIVFDHLGRGYFLEYMFSTITVVSPSLQYLYKFNNPVNGVYPLTGYQQGQIAFVADLAFDRVNKRLFVSCDGGRIEIFGIDGGGNPVYVNNPPTVPAAQSPKADEVVLTNTPVLTYAAATDDRDTTLTYQVVIKQGDATVKTFDPTTATSVTVPADLLSDDVVYSWMVQAVDSDGAVSGFSAAATFVVNTNDPPSLPVAQTPVGGSVVETEAPTLTYQAAVDDYDTTLSYQVVVKQGAAEVYSVTTSATSITVPAGVLAENAAYTWTVQAADSKGLVSGFSAPSAFVVNAVSEPPSAPVLQTELAEAALANERQFAWSVSTDPDPNDAVKNYLVELATDAEFTTLVDAMTVVDGTAATLGDFAKYADLVVGATYFCRVSAVDLADNASPSEAVTFVYDTSVLTVDAGIKGAAVYLGGNLAYPGRFVGVTPLELRDLAPGGYVVAVEAAGFELNLTQVALADLTKSSVAAQLKPAQQPTVFKGAKAINGKPGLKVGAGAVPFVVDFDGDGKLDLLAGDANGSVSLYRTALVSSKGEMTVGPAEVVPGLAGQVLPGAVPFVADWNNDNLNDLLVGLVDGTVKLFISGGADSLLQAGDVPLAVGAAAAPAVIDLNRDGLKDLVVGNALGQVFACYNAGSDAAPKLAAPVQLFSVGVPAVPTAVDWNSDGIRELMVASAKGVGVYSNESGAFVAAPVLATPAKAVFAVDADASKGEDLIVGMEDGRLLFVQASSAIYPPAYPTALNTKVDEVETLMGEAQETTAELMAIVIKIREQIAAGSFSGVAVQAQNLAAALVDIEAKAAADELSALCAVETVGTVDPGPKPGKNSK